MTKEFQKIVVVGLGYIGLPTASMLASKGHSVLGVDTNKEIVDIINSGGIHIVEPDLDVLVKAAVSSGNLRASLIPEEADTFIIAVPTPFKEIEGNAKAPDISYIESATKSILSFLQEDNLVILESTSPVGSTETIEKIIIKNRPDLINKIYVAHCPERVLPGQILHELIKNDRIIGANSEKALEKATSLYQTFCKGDIFKTDSRTAEISKLIENSFRDVNIAFANELSLVCDRLNINVWEAISLANRHPRVNILMPGPGVGGHCIAVDPWFIVASAPQEARIIKVAREINDSKPDWVIKKVFKEAERLSYPTVGCLGITFKANIDDIRESPALEIVLKLQKSNIGKIMACDPNVKYQRLPFPTFGLEEVLLKSDIILLLVDHKEFLNIDKSILKNKIIIDTKGIFNNI